MPKRRIVLVIHNVRSAQNVGSMLRSADGFGVEQVCISGYSPYPPIKNDSRLPHIATRAGKQIAKTALGAEKSIPWRHEEDVSLLLSHLRMDGYFLLALEQTKGSSSLPLFKPPASVALVVGNEIDGIEPEVLKLCDQYVEIPMSGGKESFNVSVAAGIALYHLRYN